MARPREFKPASIEFGARRVRGFRIECCKCGTHESVPVNSLKHGDAGREAKIIERKFADQGWVIGRNQTSDVCKRCKVVDAAVTIAKESKEELMPTVAAPAEPMPIQIVNADDKAVPQMTTDDALTIVGKLQEVYLDKNKGYAEDWTDAKVARDIGVPRDWVRQVRVKFYGDGKGGNDDIAEQVEAARAVLADCRTVFESVGRIEPELKKLLADAARISSSTGTLRDRADRIERALVGIEKALR